MSILVILVAYHFFSSVTIFFIIGGCVQWFLLVIYSAADLGFAKGGRGGPWRVPA